MCLPPHLRKVAPRRRAGAGLHGLRSSAEARLRPETLGSRHAECALARGCILSEPKATALRLLLLLLAEAAKRPTLRLLLRQGREW